MSYSSKTALLANIIDYAGTFPPAKLSLQDSLKKAATFRLSSQHPWLLSKVALLVSDLKTISNRELYQSGADGSPWFFTALSSIPSSTDIHVFTSALERELHEVKNFNERGSDSSVPHSVKSYEMKLPLVKPTDMSGYLSPILERFLPTGLTPFFELDKSAHWEESLQAAGEVLSLWCSSQMRPGLKIRLGSESLPTAKEISIMILTCDKWALRFKATQSLHHAYTQNGSYGFINLFAALSLGHALNKTGFGASEIVDCLETNDKSRFRFDAEALHFDEFQLDVAGIEKARAVHGASFGSCSLDEPDESLTNENL